MRIAQILPTISYGDAVSNSAVNMMKELLNYAEQTSIFAINIHPKMKKHAKPLSDFKQEKWDVMIYHMAIGCNIPDQIANWSGIKHKWMVYHNITPSRFFKGYDANAEHLTKWGREQLLQMKNMFSFIFADSDYNREELLELGYQNVETLPILINFEDYSKQPNQEVLQKYNDDYINLLFVGRVAPNKRHDEIIKQFYYYQKYVNEKSRLFLVGSFQGMETYYSNLVTFMEELGVKNVIFTGHIPFEEILSYYRLADVFLSMSEHEGFCVPLVEAMYFQVPIIAYNTSAIPSTLGNSGILINRKEYLEVAEMIHLVATNCELREKLVKRQNEMLKKYDKQLVAQQFISITKRLLS